MRRRDFTVQLGLAGLVSLAPGRAWARSTVQEKRLQNRLELWANYAKRTENLIARTATRRESALLDEPLVTTGTLYFRAPRSLLMRDDDLTGSTTRIEGNVVRISPNGAETPDPPLDPDQFPASAWLRDRLLRVFAPGEPEDLIDNARVEIPRGRGYRLELFPPRGSTIRKSIRAVSLELDAVAGAVIRLVIAETQGDRVTIELTDHRQNVDAADIERAFSLG